MKHTLKRNDATVTATIALDQAELTDAKNNAITNLAKSVKAPGFRKGKAPAKVAEKSLDPNLVANETMEQAINRALNELINQEDLRVLDQPKIEIKKFVPFTTLEFTAEIEVLPFIKLGDYKKLKAKKQAIKVEKAEIDQVIDQIRTSFAERKAVKRAIKNGDEAVIDFVGRDEAGGLIEGAKGDDYPLTVGSQTFIPGFEEQLVGHKSGEKFDIEVTFPKDYHADHLKNAKVTFAVHIKSVNQVTLPEVDDALAKKAGPFDNAKEFRADIKRELTDQKERQALDQLKDDLLGELVGNSSFPVPQVLVDDQIASLERDMTQNLAYRGQTLEQYMESRGYKDRQELTDKELRPMAERRVQSGLVLAELSKAEKIEVTHDELEAELAKRKEEAPSIASQLDTPEARRDLANRVITEKTIERLVDLNT